jgi:hypothetical protein
MIFESSNSFVLSLLTEENKIKRSTELLLEEMRRKNSYFESSEKEMFVKIQL